MKRMFLFFLISFALSANLLFAQKSDDIALESEKLPKYEFNNIDISPDGKYLIMCKSINTNGLPAFDNKFKQRLSTIVIDIKTGKTRNIIYDFVYVANSYSQNKIIGITPKGFSYYDLLKNQVFPIENMPIPKLLYSLKVKENYILLCQFNVLSNYYSLGEINNGVYKQLWQYKGKSGFRPNFIFHPSEKKIIIVDDDAPLSADKKQMPITELDLETGNELAKYNLPEEGYCQFFQFTSDGKKVIYNVQDKIYIKNFDNLTKSIGVIKVGKNSFDDMWGSLANNDGSLILTHDSNDDKKAKIWENGKLLCEIEISDKLGFLSKGFNGFQSFGNNDLFLMNIRNGISSIISVKEKKIIGQLKIDFNSWAVVADDGRMDGAESSIKKLFWHNYTKNEKIPLSATYQQFYTPNLLASLLSGQTAVKNEVSLEEVISNSPSVQIVKPDSITSTTEGSVALQIKATPHNNEKVKEIQIFINNKAIETDIRGFKPIEQTDLRTISLVPGENIIQVIAVSEHGYQSAADQIIVNYKYKSPEINLYVLAIGINQYKNNKYNLNFATSDAQSFIEKLQAGSIGLFTKTDMTFVKDDEATRTNIITKFNEIKSKVQPQDVFVFYYAGHGVMSEEAKPMFYIIPNDVTQLYGNTSLLQNNGISAVELQNFSKEVKAQKQLFMLDACQTGGMVNQLAQRGAIAEKSIAQLARSTGTVWIAASGTEQFAQEFGDLKHGLFTYCLLQAFSGLADGSPKDQRITVGELSSYLNTTVPELSKKFRGSEQYPNVYSFGQDFPIIIVK